jgi:biotin carboxylase
MPNVVFVLPFAKESSLRFVRAAAMLPDVRLALVSQDPVDKLPEELRHLLAGFLRVDDGLSAAQLTVAVQKLGRQLGSVDALLGILEQLQEPLAEVRETLRIRGMDRSEASNFRDKAQMKAVLAEHGLPCARYLLCHGVEEGVAFARTSGYPLVGKPPFGAGAKTTERLVDEAGLRSFLQGVRVGPERAVLLEEFVQGSEFSFDAITIEGRHAFHSIGEYHPTPLQVLEDPEVQWCVVLPRDIATERFAPIRATGPQALRALGMWTGMAHMEWFLRRDGSIAIGEVAARPPGAQFMTLMSYAHDTDMYRAFAQLMIFGSFALPQRNYAAGAVYLRGVGNGEVKGVTGFEPLQQALGNLIVEQKLPKPGQPKADSYEGEGYVIVRHPDTIVVERAVKQLAERVRVQLG